MRRSSFAPATIHVHHESSNLRAALYSRISGGSSCAVCLFLGIHCRSILEQNKQDTNPSSMVAKSIFSHEINDVQFRLSNRAKQTVSGRGDGSVSKRFLCKYNQHLYGACNLRVSHATSFDLWLGGIIRIDEVIIRIGNFGRSWI